MEYPEGGDISIEHFLQDHQDNSSNSLQQTFQNSCVLVTGVTGILGSFVLEKLLRSCVGVKKVYVTVRSKEGKSASERLEELFCSKMFDKVKLEKRESLNKVELLDLDLGLEGYSDKIALSINMLIHCALFVDPLTTLKEAVQANIRNTEALLKLAYSCSKLEAFVVGSSILCHHKKDVVEEKFYNPAISAKTMTVICDDMTSSVLESDTTGFVIADTSASYICLGILEDFINDKKKFLPMAIVRPSMLVASYQQPLAGWLPQVRKGLMRVLTNVMQGRLCTICLDSNLSAELVPADLAASHLLAVTAHTASTRKNWKNKEIDDIEYSTSIILDNGVPIFNLVSSNHSPISWRDFFVCSIKHARKVPFLDTAWYPHLIITGYNIWFSLWFFILHLVPAWCTDRYYKFMEGSNNANLYRSYEKYQLMNDYCRSLKLHTFHSQKYVDHNTEALWNGMSSSDRETFKFHLSQLDWDEYIYTLVRGFRLYCQGDTLDTIPRSAARMSRLKLLHYSCVVLGSFLTILLLHVLLKLLLFY